MSELRYRLKIPNQCDNCNSLNIKLVKTDYDNEACIYYCKDCRASVGCHFGTNIPLGKMATKEIRILRKQAHEAFDVFWNTGLMSRSEAYLWLADKLEIEISECHISWLSKDRLIEAIFIASTYFSETRSLLTRRKLRNERKEQKREERQCNENRRTFEETKRRKTKRRT
jgi:hypothetical protein